MNLFAAQLKRIVPVDAVPGCFVTRNSGVDLRQRQLPIEMPVSGCGGSLRVLCKTTKT